MSPGSCAWRSSQARTTGNPYFTTDTTAALRGMELKCDAIIKGTDSEINQLETK